MATDQQSCGGVKACSSRLRGVLGSLKNWPMLLAWPQCDKSAGARTIFEGIVVCFLQMEDPQPSSNMHVLFVWFVGWLIGGCCYCGWWLMLFGCCFQSLSSFLLLLLLFVLVVVVVVVIIVTCHLALCSFIYIYIYTQPTHEPLLASSAIVLKYVEIISATNHLI